MVYESLNFDLETLNITSDHIGEGSHLFPGLKLLQLSPRRREFSLGRYGEPNAVRNAITGDSNVIETCRVIRESETHTACQKVGEFTEFEIASPMLNVFEIPNRCGLHNLLFINPEGNHVSINA